MASMLGQVEQQTVTQILRAIATVCMHAPTQAHTRFPLVNSHASKQQQSNMIASRLSLETKIKLLSLKPK